MRKKIVESGADEMRRAVRVLGCCRETDLEPYTAEQLLKLVRACWASGWDVYVSDLSAEQCVAAIDLGEVPAFFDGPRGLECVPSSSADAEDWHLFLCHPVGDDCVMGAGACPVSEHEDRAMVARAAVRVRSVKKESV